MVLGSGHLDVAARRRRVVRGDAAPAAGGEAADQAAAVSCEGKVASAVSVILPPLSLSGTCKTPKLPSLAVS